MLSCTRHMLSSHSTDSYRFVLRSREEEGVPRLSQLQLGHDVQQACGPLMTSADLTMPLEKDEATLVQTLEVALDVSSHLSQNSRVSPNNVALFCVCVFYF